MNIRIVLWHPKSFFQKYIETILIVYFIKIEVLFRPQKHEFYNMTFMKENLSFCE